MDQCLIPVIVLGIFSILCVLRGMWVSKECRKVDLMPVSTERERDEKECRMAELGYYDW